MNSTNRALNRIVLLVAGLMLLIGGIATVALWTASGTVTARDRLADELAVVPDRLGAWRVDLGWFGLGSTPVVLLLVPAAAILLVALVIAFSAAQGHGRTRQTLRIPLRPGAAAGTLEVDVSVAEEMIGQTLAARRDVVDTQVRAYIVRRHPVVSVRIAPRRGADLPGLLERIATVTEDWNALLGRRVPVVVHLARGSWRSLRRDVRVE